MRDYNFPKQDSVIQKVNIEHKNIICFIYIYNTLRSFEIGVIIKIMWQYKKKVYLNLPKNYFIFFMQKYNLYNYIQIMLKHYYKITIHWTIKTFFFYYSYFTVWKCWFDLRSLTMSQLSMSIVFFEAFIWPWLWAFPLLSQTMPLQASWKWQWISSTRVCVTAVRCTVGPSARIWYVPVIWMGAGTPVRWVYLSY